MMQSGVIPPFIIVLPQGDTGYWVDHAGGGRQHKSAYVARDLVAEIDARFRTAPSARAARRRRPVHGRARRPAACPHVPRCVRRGGRP
ncbi:MAG: hypothetical protein U0531_13755 [Dehalococcoidia bacterium]